MTKDKMMMVALLFSTALSTRPEAYPADWADEHDELPDLALGTANNWWLRINDTGELYIQARDASIDREYTIEIADKMHEVAHRLMGRLTIAVALPWRASDVYDAARALRDKKHQINESVKAEARRDQAQVSGTWIILHEGMGDVIENMSLSQSVELLLRQRDEARQELKMKGPQPVAEALRVIQREAERWEGIAGIRKVELDSTRKELEHLTLFRDLKCDKCGHHAHPDDTCGHCMVKLWKADAEEAVELIRQVLAAADNPDNESTFELASQIPWEDMRALVSRFKPT